MQSAHPFIEIKQRLDGSLERFECLPVQVSDGEAVVLHKRSKPGQVEDVVLPAGSLSFGYFWSNRHYNVYHFVTQTGETLGIYFNVCDQTVIGKGLVSWRDLIIDVLVTPDGRCRVLDAEELPPTLHRPLIRLIAGTQQHLENHYENICAELTKRTAAYMIRYGQTE